MEEEEEEEEDAYEEDGARGSRATSLASDEAEVAEDSEWERTESQRNSASNCDSAAPSLCSDGRLSTVAPEDVFLDHSDELKPVELDTEEAGSLTRQLVKRLTLSEITVPAGSATEGGGTVGWAGEGSRAFLESSLEEAIQSLLMKLESLTHRCRELQDLEQEVMRLEDLLKVSVLKVMSNIYLTFCWGIFKRGCSWHDHFHLHLHSHPLILTSPYILLCLVSTARSPQSFIQPQPDGGECPGELRLPQHL